MKPVNETLRFEELPENHQHAFSNGIGEKIYFGAGSVFFRFGDGGLSPWWVEGSLLMDTLNKAKISGKTLEQYVRQNSAVLRQWAKYNRMTYLTVIALKADFYGFIGSCSPQNEASIFSDPKSKYYKARYTKAVYFKGGGKQVYLPNLTPEAVDFIVPYGRATIWDPIDHIVAYLTDFQAFVS